MLAGTLWLSCCWPGRCGGKPSGISCWPGRRGGEPSGISCWPVRRGEAASGSQQTHTKEKGPEETLISLPSRFYLLPCERATCHATRPNCRSPPAFTAGICRRHAVQAQLPLQLCRDCKEGCSKCKNCVELWEYGKDEGVTEYVLSV